MSRVVRLLRFAAALLAAWVLWAVVFVLPIPMLPRAIEVQAGDASIPPFMGALAVAGFLLFTYLAFRYAARPRVRPPSRVGARTRVLVGSRTH